MLLSNVFVFGLLSKYSRFHSAEQAVLFCDADVDSFDDHLCEHFVLPLAESIPCGDVFAIQMDLLLFVLLECFPLCSSWWVGHVGQRSLSEGSEDLCLRRVRRRRSLSGL